MVHRHPIRPGPVVLLGSIVDDFTSRPASRTRARRPGVSFGLEPHRAESRGVPRVDDDRPPSAGVNAGTTPLQGSTGSSALDAPGCGRSKPRRSPDRTGPERHDSPSNRADPRVTPARHESEEGLRTKDWTLSSYAKRSTFDASTVSDGPGADLEKPTSGQPRRTLAIASRSSAHPDTAGSP